MANCKDAIQSNEKKDILWLVDRHLHQRYLSAWIWDLALQLWGNFHTHDERIRLDTSHDCRGIFDEKY
jgi:hypothetical protein